MNESRQDQNSIPATLRMARFIIVVTRFQPVILGLVYMLLSSVMSTVVFRVTGYMDFVQRYAKTLQEGGNLMEFTLPTPGVTDLLVVVVLLLLLRLLLAGFQISMLMLTRGRLAKIRDLMEGFSAPLRMLGTSLLVSLLTGLGYMLFLVPGIYLNYRYMFAIEALYDDPSLSPIGALRRSAQLTKGHIIELLLLDLSFLPWVLGNLALTMLLSVSVLDAWIQPYQRLSFAIRYNMLSGWTPDPATMPPLPPEISQELRNQMPEYWLRFEETPQPQETVPEPTPEPREEPQPLPQEPQPPTPDLEYWKARAVRLQQELSQKNEEPREKE